MRNKMTTARQVALDYTKKIAAPTLTTTPWDEKGLLDLIISKLGWPVLDTYEQGGLWTAIVDGGETNEGQPIKFGITVQQWPDDTPNTETHEKPQI